MISYLIVVIIRKVYKPKLIQTKPYEGG